MPHHADPNKNVLWLGQDAPDSRSKYRLSGLPKDEGRREWRALPCSASESPPETTVAPESGHGLDSKTATPAKTRCSGELLPEIADLMVAEITDEATYQEDWVERGGRSSARTGTQTRSCRQPICCQSVQDAGIRTPDPCTIRRSL